MDSTLQTDDRPNVPLPAPVYLGLFSVAGYLVNRLLPLTLGAEPYLLYAGWAVILLATILLLQCFALFIRRRTTIMPRNPVSAMVEQGPYRHSRNPMYLSLVLYQLGIGIATGNAWILLTLPPMLLCIHFLVVRPEERYMIRRFPEQYSAYCQRVPRWL